MRATTNLFVMLTVLAEGCGPPPSPAPPVPAGWQTVLTPGFAFRAPPDLQPVPVQGVDSIVGRYESPTLAVDYDLGWYSDPMDREGYTRRRVTVDGKAARLVTKDDVVAIHFPKLGRQSKLTMSVRLKGADAKEAEAIVRSIDFP